MWWFITNATSYLKTICFCAQFHGAIRGGLSRQGLTVHHAGVHKVTVYNSTQDLYYTKLLNLPNHFILNIKYHDLKVHYTGFFIVHILIMPYIFPNDAVGQNICYVQNETSLASWVDWHRDKVQPPRTYVCNFYEYVDAFLYVYHVK